MKELYHGTISKFDVIDVNAGKGYKDFGKGFYATAVAQHAERLAKRNKSIAEKRQALLKVRNDIKTEPIIAYRYNLLFNEETEGLSVKIFTSADIEWLRFIMRNRECSGSAHDYDIVIGPTADIQVAPEPEPYHSDIAVYFCGTAADNICGEVIYPLASVLFAC